MIQKGGMGAAPTGLGSLSKGQPMPPSGLSKRAAPRGGELPYAPMTEQILLGEFLLDADRCVSEGTARMLAPEDFCLPEHQAIWRAIQYEIDNHEPVTIPTVAWALEKLRLIDKVDEWLGPPYTEPYLVQIAAYSFTAVGSSAHAKIIKDYSERRKQIERGTELVREAYEGTKKGGWVTLD